MTDHDDIDEMISQYHEILDAEQERDPNFGWDKSKQRLKPEEPTAQPRALPTAPQIRPLAEVEERPISWLWPGHLALGRLTVVAGEPGAGASLLLLEVASRVSRGRSFPPRAFPGAEHDVSDAPREAAEVLLITHQDLAEVVKPRLAALGADTKMFHVMGDVPDVTFIEETPCVRPFRAYSDLAHLDSFLASTPSVKLVVIDPLDLYLEQGNRSFPSKTLRELGELAARRGVAIVAAARAPEVPGAVNLRRWLDKLSGVAELALLFAVVRDRRRPCRRYLAAAKNTLADMDDALSFETPEGRVAWGRRRVSAAVCWATAARLDQEDAARWLRDELGLGPKTAKELRAAADEAGIPWHVVYRSKGIAGADCGRVGGGAGSYFVWSLFDPLEEAEESQESAELGTRSAERREPTEASENEIGNSRESAKSSIENTKTGGESAEPTRFAGAHMRSAERIADVVPTATEHPKTEVEYAQERAKSSIENTKRGVARGARPRQPLPLRRPRAEAEGEPAMAQFSDPTTDTESCGQLRTVADSWLEGNCPQAELTQVDVAASFLTGAHRMRTVRTVVSPLLSKTSRASSETSSRGLPAPVGAQFQARPLGIVEEAESGGEKGRAGANARKSLEFTIENKKTSQAGPERDSAGEGSACDDGAGNGRAGQETAGRKMTGRDDIGRGEWRAEAPLMDPPGTLQRESQRDTRLETENPGGRNQDRASERRSSPADYLHPMFEKSIADKQGSTRGILATEHTEDIEMEER